jgi:SAM-dependent methyltransferase
MEEFEVMHNLQSQSSMSDNNSYQHWADTYNESVQELSESIWKEGIIQELVRLGILRGRVLDAGAGTGVGCRLLRELGEYEIIAVDRSDSMLKNIGKAADSIICSDLASLPDEASRYDAVVSGFDTLNYLDAEHLSQFFAWVSRNMSVGGRLIFDYSSPRYLRDDWRELSYDQVLRDGSVLMWHHQWDHAKECSRTRISLLNNSEQVWQEDHIQYSFDAYRLHQLAQSSGLAIIYMRNLDAAIYSPDTETHLVVMGHRFKSGA